MQFKVYSRKYRDVMAAYGRHLAPYYDREACYQYRMAVINLETVADFCALRDAIGQEIKMDGNNLEIVDAPEDFFDYLRTHPDPRREIF